MLDAGLENNSEQPQVNQQASRQVSRMTRQRALIMAELRSVTSHPTADEIYAMVRRKLPRISLGTVYRNLDLLTDNNEILCLEYAGFQKRFDGNVNDHQHVRCMHCGRVADVTLEVPTPELPKNMYVPDFTVLCARVEFFGVCESCRQAEMAARHECA